MKSQFVTAKELAPVVEMNERHIIRPATQRRLGISSCRDRTCNRPIRFHRERTLTALRQRGYTPNF